METQARGQSSVEWLVTHSWAILIVLSVSAVLIYSGVFEAVARPRFEGLDAAFLQPVPDQVQFYSDGIMVFTVVNTRPYSVKFEFIEVAPIADREDVVRTVIDSFVPAGDLRVFEVNASNLLSTVEASLLFPFVGKAASQTVSFHVCIRESFSGGGKQSSHRVCGIALNVESFKDPYPADECITGGCPCDTAADCPLVCQGCPGWCDNEIWCDTIYGDGYSCKATGTHPEGECVAD